MAFAERGTNYDDAHENIAYVCNTVYTLANNPIMGSSQVTSPEGSSSIASQIAASRQIMHGTHWHPLMILHLCILPLRTVARTIAVPPSRTHDVTHSRFASQRCEQEGGRSEYLHSCAMDEDAVDSILQEVALSLPSVEVQWCRGAFAATCSI